ncbi:MAG: 30S ribosomal protein S6 [Patescibacteria group bacterium]
MDSEAKNYELAYLLSPSLTEGETLGIAGKLSAVIEGEKGAIRRVETAKKRRLAYAVKKERNAYFGWTTFAALPAAIASIDKKTKEMSVLRHLVVEEEIETRRPLLRTYDAGAGRAIPAAGPQTPAVPREQEDAGEKLDFEALDKKLEEILGK